MGKKEKTPAIVMTDGKREIIHRLLGEYDIKTAKDIQEALKEKDISSIDRKIILMNGRGLSTRQISDTIEEL